MASRASHDDLNQQHTERPTSGLAANPHNPSSAAYLAYPVKHVVSSLYRRMTEPPDQPVNKLLDAPVMFMKSAQSSIYTLPRRASPFQPPPLSPLQLSHSLSDTRAESLLLTRSLAEEIRLLIPPRLQLVDSWRLAYNLELHGSSLGTLYEHCERALGALGSTQRGGFVLLVQDGSEAASSGAVFGAYLTDLPKPQQHYFGTGECFLWRASILPSLASIAARSQSIPIGNSGRTDAVSEDLLELAGLPPPPSADTTNAQRTTTVRGERRRSSAATSPISPRKSSSLPGPHANGGQNSLLPPRSPSPAPSMDGDRIRFKAFPYSGVNDFMIYCQRDYLSVGGGDGHYGLWLDHDLENGISESCPTFGNEPLSEEGKKFDVLGVEIWYVGGS
ncbi:oxidation resistance protein 1 [Neophaeococcomyces mojaviensis]|uniref:Oxidation resistance protein 1 n=1 Tax=Neophaeococcomyces mojaviensis TaxID=3383035 RepID=A0ACC2ZXL0_9EURO|nr:oxidation resistance protein 1 [Knufia sp. JES_112]